LKESHNFAAVNHHSITNQTNIVAKRMNKMTKKTVRVRAVQ